MKASEASAKCRVLGPDEGLWPRPVPRLLSCGTVVDSICNAIPASLVSATLRRAPSKSLQYRIQGRELGMRPVRDIKELLNIYRHIGPIQGRPNGLPTVDSASGERGSSRRGATPMSYRAESIAEFAPRTVCDRQVAPWQPSGATASATNCGRCRLMPCFRPWRNRTGWTQPCR